MEKQRILVCNDDGIHSPGLKAAVETLLGLAEVIVVAPRVQQTGMGRSWTGNPEARLTALDYHANGQLVEAYYFDASPAVTLRHGLDFILGDQPPDLIISGINYGENLGINVSISGTLGVAMEGASAGIPALAFSKETEIESHHKYTEQNWEGAKHFVRFFAQSLLSQPLPEGVDLLTVNVPEKATHETPWKMTRLSKKSHYHVITEGLTRESKLGDVRYSNAHDLSTLEPGTDIHTFVVDGAVAVTPLVLDQTSRIDLLAFQQSLQEAL